MCQQLQISLATTYSVKAVNNINYTLNFFVTYYVLVDLSL